jgi:uncharacterized protein (DUF1501 family)
MDRRTLLKYIAYHSLTLPLWLHARNEKTPAFHKNVILIELKGGNDGLNTIIPYSDPLYYQNRPTIGIAKNQVLPIDKQIGMHPAMQALKNIYDNHELAIIQGVGYPDPNRSHFRSIEIWDTASSAEEYLDEGWINALHFSQEDKLTGVILSGEYGPLEGSAKGVIMLNNIKGFLQQSNQVHSRITMTGENNALLHILQTETEIRKGADTLRQSLRSTKPLAFAFDKSDFGNQMHTTTELINGGSNIPFFKLSLGSFDTHTNQSMQHAKLLETLCEGISTMRKNLIASGKWENTVIMTYSEFGRRVAQNASGGTDHGTAAPHFIVGGRVKGGVYGEHPSLSTLDSNGDLIYTTDFRSIYNSIAKEFLGASSERLSSCPTISLFS